MALNAQTLVSSIKSELSQVKYTLTKPGQQPEQVSLFNFSNKLPGMQENPSELFIRVIIEKTLQHIVSNMEIKNVQVADPSGSVEVYAAGVGSNGGVLNAGQYPVVGSILKAQQTLSQSNSGQGLVL